VYIAVVGIIYSLLLRALWEPTGLAFAADEALHDVIPILYVLYWLLCVPKGMLRFGMPAVWLAYPIGYIVWTLVRGSLAGDYPYPFADPIPLGYAKVALNSVGVLAGFYALGLVLVAIDQLIGRARHRNSG
jgi:hypothetical protein